MKDSQIQNSLARLMVIGTLIAAAIMLAGLVWYLTSHVGLKPDDHVFTGEPKYFEKPIAMVHRVMNTEEIGHRRSLVMIGVVLLLINPVLRVAFAVLGFAAQRDKLYTAISLFVLGVLLFSFFW